MTKRLKQQAAALRDLFVQEALRILDLSQEKWSGRFIASALNRPALRLAELVETFDQHVAGIGLYEASRRILTRFVHDVQVKGVDLVPSKGPLLIASNHPGMIDGLLITANLPRPDIKIVVSAMPFFSHLRAVRDHLILTSRNTYERLTVVRSVIHHLQEGGAVLIFPRGIIEPDPGVLHGAQASLARWSPSLEIMLRKVPQTAVLVTIVRDVLSSRSLRNPLTLLRRETHERQIIAEVVQAIQHLFLPRTLALAPSLSFGIPFTLADIAERFHSANPMDAIRKTAASLLTDQR